MQTADHSGRRERRGLHESCGAMEVAEDAEETTSAATARVTQQRPRLLYNCAVASLTVARKAYDRVENLDGPVGAIAKKLASCAAPILHPLQHLWLSFLSFADGHILAAENAIVSVFPPSAYLFSLLDELALLSEALPKKFDDAADNLPAVLHRVPPLAWASARLGEAWMLLAFLWGGGGAGEEREIGVDTSCDQHPAAVGSGEEGDAADVLQEGYMEVAPWPPLDSFDEDSALKLLEYDVQRARYIQKLVREGKAAEANQLQNTGGAAEDDIVDEEELASAKSPADDAGGKPTPPETQVPPTKDPILELFNEWSLR